MSSSPDRLQASHAFFVDFATAFYESAGWRRPAIESDAQTPVAFEAHVEGVAFKIGYDPHSAPPSLFVHCALGTLHANTEPEILRSLLESNFSLVRQFGAACCVDEATQEIAWYLRIPLLHRVDLDAFNADMARLARRALDWRAQPTPPGELLAMPLA